METQNVFLVIFLVLGGLLLFWYVYVNPKKNLKRMKAERLAEEEKKDKERIERYNRYGKYGFENEDAELIRMASESKGAKPFLSDRVVGKFVMEIDYPHTTRAEQGLIREYINKLQAPIHSLVPDLLFGMMRAVPLETIEEVEEVGFLSDLINDKSEVSWEDNEFLLKALCGLRQEGLDVSQLKNSDGSFKTRAQVERIIVELKRK